MLPFFQELISWKDNLKKINDNGENDNMKGVPIHSITDDRSQGSKFGNLILGKKKKEGEKEKIFVTVLNFRLGQILPEEFFYILNKYLNDNIATLDSVLITTTAQIKTRFPLLNKESLFFPVLVDIIKSKGLFSIFIDALDSDNDLPKATLQAAADCAIFIERNKNKDNILTVENIRGKNYDRKPRKYEVEGKQLFLDLVDPKEESL